MISLGKSNSAVIQSTDQLDVVGHDLNGRIRDQAYYDPKTGRFISEDPIGLAGDLNVYNYVEGNPVNFVDPGGYSKRKVAVWIFKRLPSRDSGPGQTRRVVAWTGYQEASPLGDEVD